MAETVIKIEDIYKKYRLGTIGGGTLRGDLQSFWARIRKKEDPNMPVGAPGYKKGDEFMALDGVSTEIKKGETVGIIGANGAGKSTLLKLMSRVTAPTKGKIYIKGKISSMLEVGTGFHPELTGRENIYLNGAILGMSRSEVNEKIEDIIEFSECRQFIDTPVKRYSSGMYVKLAFSVAAHLDSDIILMDEVLAVGDMKFQKKCIDKMKAVAHNNGRTILYVSHNMNTVKQLCSRCIVLKKGKIIYDGDVGKAVDIYLEGIKTETKLINSFEDGAKIQRFGFLTDKIRFDCLEVLDKCDCCFEDDEKLKFRLKWHCTQDMDNISVRFIFHNAENSPIATAFCMDFLKPEKGKCYENIFTVDISMLSKGFYKMFMVAFEKGDMGEMFDADAVWPALSFEKRCETAVEWRETAFGRVILPNVTIE